MLTVQRAVVISPGYDGKLPGPGYDQKLPADPIFLHHVIAPPTKQLSLSFLSDIAHLPLYIVPHQDPRFPLARWRPGSKGKSETAIDIVDQALTIAEPGSYLSLVELPVITK